MKKFKKVVSLLMMSAMLVLPTVMPVQAEEVNNIDTKEAVVYNTNKFGNATIKGDGIRIRKEPNTNDSTPILGLLYDGNRVEIITQSYSYGTFWYYIKTESGIKGFIQTRYAIKD